MKKLFFPLLSILLFVACSNDYFHFGKEKVHVVLPDFTLEFDETCPQLSGWHVEIYSESEIREFFTRDSGFDIYVEKNEVGCVLATPIVKNFAGEDVIFFKPAGNLICEIDFALGNELILDWYKGYCAYLVKVFFDETDLENGHNEETWNVLACFNWFKMIDVMEERVLDCEIKGCFYNPWVIAPETVTRQIALHSFRASHLTMKQYFELENLCDNKIYSSFVPENKNIKKNHKILIKQSEVNLISDYNLDSIIVTGTSVKYKIKYAGMPQYIIGYE